MANFPHVLWHTLSSPNGNGISVQPNSAKKPFSPASFAAVVEVWPVSDDAEADMTDEAFYEAFDREACTDWNKMEPDGTSFGGAFLAPKGSAEHEDALAITRRTNGMALLKLPYPRKAILFAMDFLCNLRCESVVRVADWLEAVRRESARLGTMLPLMARVCRTKEKEEATPKGTDQEETDLCCFPP